MPSQGDHHIVEIGIDDTKSPRVSGVLEVNESATAAQTAEALELKSLFFWNVVGVFFCDVVHRVAWMWGYMGILNLSSSEDPMPHVSFQAVSVSIAMANAFGINFMFRDHLWLYSHAGLGLRTVQRVQVVPHSGP
jgi:hypothetical protein